METKTGDHVDEECPPRPEDTVENAERAADAGAGRGAPRGIGPAEREGTARPSRWMFRLGARLTILAIAALAG